MDKTEKRTAEEMYLYCVEQMQPDGTNCSLDDEKTIYKAMHEYAAQELDAYKARLKEEINKIKTNSESVVKYAALSQIIELIDKL